MDLVGIENEAEFFPAGTLSDALQDELRDITAQWANKSEGENPATRLMNAASAYLTVVRQMRNSHDRDHRAELRRSATHALVTSLGYDYHRALFPSALVEGALVPVVARIADSDGRDVAWLLEAPLEGSGDEASDPLGASFAPDQFAEEEREFAETERSIAEILGDGIFGLRNGPRYVLILGLSQIVLADRHKWPARSVLRFDLQEIFSRQDADTLAVMACLISREARAPRQGIPIADRIEEEAQRNANAVTTSLKRTIRDAIEIIGQEVLDVTSGKYPSGPRQGVWIDGPELSLECLRYMYRLLFLFYAEANPRLNILDLRDPVYASGYSLEALRELESIRLRTAPEKNGSYLWDSLQRTLTLLYDGRGTALRLPAVKVSLLDPEQTPILNAVRLRNEAVQKVIRLLSLKRSRSGTARISYAKLGIGQLGAVYETLISFTGVVAKQDLIELRPQTGRGSADTDEEDQETFEVDSDELDEGEEVPVDETEEDAVSRSDKVDLLAPSYFVPRSRINEFRTEEIVFYGAEARVYKKGSFIYRLAGRDREKSASYYTPEPLARLLVKHALMEQCKDLTADELLELKILEPAMGSAAFLVETTNQLADLYLERKQKEVGQTIPQERILIEKQKVRSFIADRNCFGVDRNPVAVELGAISLWLNGLHASEFSPWFGDQLHAGNSLISARRASYPPTLTSAKKRVDLWFNQKPQEIGWKRRLPDGHIWQWLLPAKDMAKFDKDKSIEEFAGEAQEKIKAWRRSGFFDKLEVHEVKLLQKLSRVAEELFDIVAEDLGKSRASVNDAITLWPDRIMPGAEGLDFHEKERRNRRLIGVDHAANTLPYKRLKTAMDAWCALWLWPLDKVDQLPTRTEFLHGMAMMLEGGFMPDGSLAAPSMVEFIDPAPDFFDELEPETPAKDLFQAAKKKQKSLFRETDVDTLVQEVDWLGIAVEIAAKERFTHFDLIFADVLKSRGGFDVIVGNPPWAKLSWNEADVIGDIDPLFVVRKLTANESRSVRSSAVEQDRPRRTFLEAFVSAKGAQAVTSSQVMTPHSGSGSNNLYRCFVDLAFRLVSPYGAIGLIHEDGHLAETRGGEFRKNWYSRISKHFNFSNQITSKNFSEVLHTKFFSLNVYRGKPGAVSFDQFTNAFLASQVEESYQHDGVGEIPGIKKNGKWDTRGHKKRIIRVDEQFLSILARQEDAELIEGETPVLYQFLSSEIQHVFIAISTAKSLGDAPIRFQNEPMYHESGAQDSGIIMKATGWVERIEDLILSSPIIFVGNPLSKSPRRNCRVPQDYDTIDLILIPNNYLPRTNFRPAKGLLSLLQHTPVCEWNKTKRHIDHYRIGYRRRVDLGTERSLCAAIIPPFESHIDAMESISFEEISNLLIMNALFASISHDFFIKSLRHVTIRASVIKRLPWLDPGDTAKHRGLRLACLTKPYAGLWNEVAHTLTPLPWHFSDPRLSLDGPVEGPAKWDRTAALRTDFARRMALVEIDVLVAQSLGLTLDQLIDIYRIYFPVLQQNEAGTWYDRNGRVVWTCSRGLPGIGYLEEGKSPSRKRWEQILESGRAHLECVAVVDFLPGGPQRVARTFEGPFDTCDRVEDYKRAWAFFEQHSRQEAAE